MSKKMGQLHRARAVRPIWMDAALWLMLIIVFVLPVAVATTSTLLAWRDPVYVVAGFAGITALSVLLIQPLLVGGYLAGTNGQRGRKLHRWVGSGLLVCVVIHVGGLWITSPPDVIDALLFRSATPFSIWGVIAMWSLLFAALLAVFRRKLPIRQSLWRFAHSSLALIVTLGSVIHALQIEGTMGMVSKAVICGVVVCTTVWVIADLGSWSVLRRR